MSFIIPTFIFRKTVKIIGREENLIEFLLNVDVGVSFFTPDRVFIMNTFNLNITPLELTYSAENVGPSGKYVLQKAFTCTSESTE